MLYERWREVASARMRDRALVNAATGDSWTFGAMLALSDSAALPEAPWVFPRGNGIPFIFEVLRGWRHDRPVCPLEQEGIAPYPDSAPADLVHFKTTSATTGRARHVAFTAMQLAADPANLVATMGLRPDWPNLGLISLAHSYGFSSLVLPLLLHGIPLIVSPSALPEALRQTAANEPSVTLPAVPALWRSWHDAGVIPSSIRLAISAGAPLPSALEHEVFEARGLKIHNFYGASECGGIAYDASELPRRDSTWVGTPVANVQLHVATSGCLIVRGANVASRYWPTSDPALAEGTFMTADAVEIRDGVVHLRGRHTDLINVAGRKAIPEDIERAILRHPGVRQCLVFGVPRIVVEHGDSIVAVVESTNLTREALQQFVASILPAWQQPRDWWLVDAIPTNPRGKHARREWRDSYLQSRA